MANKEQLLNEIEAIPKFKLRKVAVEKDETTTTDHKDWAEQEDDFAVTEVGNYKEIAFVKGGYHLVQFADVFKPIITNMPDLEGELIYDSGFAYVYAFPVGDAYKGEKDEFGVVVVNSVNSTAGLSIRFVVKRDGRKILLPANISGFKKTHRLGTIAEMAKDYIYNLDQVKTMWATIVDKFTKVSLTKEHLENMKLDKTMAKKIIKLIDDGRQMNLWDGFTYAMDEVSKKDYKNEVRRRKKLDEICQCVLDYGLIMDL